MCSLLANSKPLPVNIIGFFCCVSVMYCLWALPTKYPQPNYCITLQLLSDQTLHHSLCFRKSPVVVYCWVSTSSNNHRCTCFCWEGRDTLTKGDGGAELTLRPKELFGLPLHWDKSDGYSYLNVPCVTMGYPTWTPGATLRGRPATRLCQTCWPLSLIPMNPKPDLSPWWLISQVVLQLSWLHWLGLCWLQKSLNASLSCRHM